MANEIQIPSGIAEWDTIPELIAARAMANDHAQMIEIDGERISYAAIESQASAIAGNLSRLGVVKGDRVGSFQHNCMSQLLLWIGANKLGAIWVPFNAALNGSDLQYTVSDADLKALVVGHDLRERIEQLDDLDQSLAIFISGGENETFSELLKVGPPPPPVKVSASDPAVIIYTGGTTGLPKGAILPHFAWIAAGYRYVEAFKPTAEDRHYSILAMFHVGGLMLGLMGPMIANIPTVVDRRFSGSRYWERVRETGATIIDPLGTMISMLLLNESSPLDKRHSVRISLAAMGQLPTGTREKFTKRFDIQTVNVYSLTEGGGVLIVNNPPGAGCDEANGKSWGWADVAIFDSEDNPCLPNVVGEIVLRSNVPNIFMQGYHKNPNRTLECLSNLWLHTGDIGYMNEEGYLFHAGRQAHWIRRRGENISAYEVESVLVEFPGVREVIAIGIPSELGEEDVKVFLISNQKVQPADIARWCETKMAHFKIPRFFEFVDDFPRSVTKQEVERQKLKELSNDQAWDRNASQ